MYKKYNNKKYKVVQPDVVGMAVIPALWKAEKGESQESTPSKYKVV